MPGRTFSTPTGIEYDERWRPGTPPRPTADAISPLTEPFRSPVLEATTTTPAVASTTTTARPTTTGPPTTARVFLPSIPQHEIHPLPPPVFTQNQSQNAENMANATSSSTFIENPAPVPIFESENPDAIALRAAMSVLLLQRERSKADIKALRTMKEKALEEPETFVDELQAGKIKSVGAKANVLEETFGNLPRRRRGFRGQDDGGIMCFDMEVPDDDAECYSETDSEDGKDPEASKFGNIPAPQNVVRCPPINWAKYHVIGESLDKLHEEQINRPTPGEPHRQPHHTAETRAPEAVFAAPYSPFTDRLMEGMTTRSATKKSAP